MRKLIYAATLLSLFSSAHAQSLSNCTVQYKSEGEVRTQQCSSFDQEENNGEYGIGVREGDLLIVFIGVPQGKDEDGIVNVKLTKMVINHTNDQPTTEVFPASTGFCRYKSGNAVECESGDFMLNGTY